MKVFRHIVPVPPSAHKISHRDPVILMGSCFTEHIGRKLARYKFNVLQNPFGIVYHPYPLVQSLERILDTEYYTEDELISRSGLWVSFDHHSRFSGPDSETVLHQINESMAEAHDFLREARFLFVSLGTARYYVRKEDQRIVANCHKFPASDFVQRRAAPAQIAKRLGDIFERLTFFNPELQIVLTVSPVRHVRDGFVENQRSKAALLLAAAELEATFDNVEYFPSYEIMMDELRDYRFYADDYAHPNQTAVHYIFERFGQAFFDERTPALIKQIEAVLKAVAHRPFHPGSDSDVLFVERTLQQIAALEQAHPELDFRAEKEKLHRRPGRATTTD